jgi:glucose 1-dehydrogenase/sorbitol-6-phosphate 2-dehydrogenase
MNLQLTDQTVAIFGASRGIGRAIAEAFSAEGCRLGLFDRQSDPQSPAGTVLSREGDVTRLDEVQAFASELGPIDHLVYAVGVGSGKFGFPFWNVPPSDWARVLDVNLIGAVNAAHAFAPALTQRGEGSVLFIVSVAGQMGSQTDPPYSAAKAGLINFTHGAAKDFAPYRVRVNALSPGMVKTALNEAVWAAGQARLPEAQRQDYETWAQHKIRTISPLGRWQTAEEMAAVAVFLASPHARNITGQTINVDGGQVMH